MDYKKIGLKCGLEIHQQLDTKKLFMNTPSVIRDDNPDIIVKRKLRAVVGESGEKDVAASFEEFAEKEFIYLGYEETNSPIELDEEPPRVMDKDALSTVLQISKILNCSIVDEVQVMRKIVVDGSNTSGFQRTSLVGRNGSLKTEFGYVGIPTISIEEDSAKIVERTDNSVTYNLSRLGIPLIEIGTDPDITSPEMAKSVAAKLGMILRSTDKVKRGLGTIRQDLNVSIANGARVEIKGAQDLRMIPKWIELEAQRQLNLIELKNLIKKRKVNVLKAKHNLTEVFKNTKCNFVMDSIKNDFVVIGIKISNALGLIGFEVQTNRRFGTELSDYSKKVSGLSGIIHSDEKLEKYNFSGKEISELKNRLNLSESDSFILVVGPEGKCEKSLDAVISRIKVASKFIPKEVRKTNPDGTTSFLRPMPGSSRMYPETDCVPIPTRDILGRIVIPELIEEKSERFQRSYSLSKDLADGLSKLDLVRISKFSNFDEAVKNYKNVQPSFIAQCLLNYPKEIKSRFNVEFVDDNYKEVFLLIEKVNNSEISKDAFIELLPKLINKEKINYDDFKPLDQSEIESKIKKIAENNDELSVGALMGVCMKEFRGKVDGKIISEILKKYMSK